ncbi:MAG: hypothetical protein V1800_00465 [Candidatus Latescibacterota bacterium]
MVACEAPPACPQHSPEMPTDLKASWIWTAEALPLRNQFVFLRKSFTLTGQPDAAVCALTAERFYQLWVNGIWLGQGPALGHPSEKACDVYDVRELLRPGKNGLFRKLADQYKGLRNTCNCGILW